MADKRKTINLLPEYFRSDKNSKFLSSTIDQFIQEPEIERINGYIGSKSTPNYNPELDLYIQDDVVLRRNYQLEPALVVRDSREQIKDVVGYDDLLNEIKIQGGNTSNHNNLIKNEFYSYDPLIDWDKLTNYSFYYWLPSGPDSILINNTATSILSTMVGQPTFTMDNGYSVSNGMKLVFQTDETLSGKSIVAGREYIVEGVGNAIELIDFSLLEINKNFAETFNEKFDSVPFDSLPFDGDKRLPVTPEYVTINKASRDLNPWTRYNRWFHEDIIKISAIINNKTPSYPVENKAKRPIVEFKANVQLYNFGNKGIKNVELIDTDTSDPFNQIQGSFGYYIDGILLEEGQTVIFNAAIDETVRGKIYQVEFTVEESPRIQLVELIVPENMNSVSINLGNQYSGTSWYYDQLSLTWIFSQQHLLLNDAPLFELFDINGVKFSELETTNSFLGTKIFGYAIGTGNSDSVLGFPLKYENNIGVGSFLFQNYFTTDKLILTINNVSSEFTTSIGYLKISDYQGTETLLNVWNSAENYQIPIIENVVVETENTTTLIVSCFDKPFNTGTTVVSYVNGIKKDSTIQFGQEISVNFVEPLKINDAVQFQLLSSDVPNTNGYYEPSLNLTNNPLNGPISYFTLSELTDHVSTMIPKIVGLNGTYPGKSNLRDIFDYSKFGTRLIINSTPLAFSQIFLGIKEHNVVDSIRIVGNLYNQFKMSLIDYVSKIESQLSPSDALDIALKHINKNKTNDSLFYRSDMVPYGEDKIVNEYSVGIVPNTIYPIGANFDITKLSFNSVLIYVDNLQLIHEQDYIIDSIDSTIQILYPLTFGNVVKIVFYKDTIGSFVPSTPSKLGLYPKFKPALVVDNSYTSGPVSMILGHDGSLTKAFGDYRDQILLEFEKRIYNNIKVNYNSSIFDIRSIIPGAFRNDRYQMVDFNNIIRKDFIEWAGAFNVNYSLNNSFDESNAFTYNFKSTVDTLFLTPMSGSWRAIYKYFYDTDRPHTHPWEMLGIDEKPVWWDTEYGVAPYTSANTLLWTDLQNGYVRGENVYKSQYARSGLSTIIPVDILGNLKSPDLFLVSESSLFEKQQPWNFGDQGPAETAWRRSSYYPFALNAAAALLDPCNYTSKLFDVSRIIINEIGQTLYNQDLYLNPSKLILNDGNNQSAGYGNFVLERGKLKDANYSSKLTNDLSYITFNLFYKLGGFTSKDKIQLIIDTLDPTSLSQGAILPPENYSLILNKSNPIDSFRISGIVVQKYNGKFLVKGYDRVRPYFEILPPIKTSVPRTVTVGGISESFVDWINIDADEKVGISTIDTTTAETNTTRYYKQGQIVRYNGLFYRVKTGHSATGIFDSSLFQQLSKLPIKGGVTVEVPSTYNPRSVQIPYGTEYNTIQEVYDLILGYGAWLESQGFIFDQYDNELFEVLDWKFSAKEFLFWTTQNWSNNNLITISPFAKNIKFSYANSIVDNINPNYDYSLLKADGKFLPKENVKITRDDGVCLIETINTEEGLFFAVLNLIQKEHAMIFDNTTLFNDTIYDIESGYRQRRFKISGFRTANWNGDLFSPGFIYDEVNIQDWKPYSEYLPGVVVRFNSEFYESISRIQPSQAFNFNEWVKLNEKPVPDLLPNFSYKINQFDDFYSLDIDNFDLTQQKLAQHLIGYTERPYLNNIFTNPTTQYKFYQGYIREKGTKNAFDKISKVGLYTRKGSINFNEEWAIRVGNYGSFETFEEIEFTLNEGTSLENPYIVKFTDAVLAEKNNLINYTSSTNVLIKSKNFNINNVFTTLEVDSYSEDLLDIATAGYVRPDDVTVTAYNKNSLLDIANNSLIQEKNTVWVGFLENGSWDVYRYTKKSAKISGVFVSAPAEEITFVCDFFHNLSVGDTVSVVNFDDQVNGIYIVKSIPKLNQFTVASELATIVDNDLVELGSLFKFESVRFDNFEDLLNFKELYTFDNGEKFWIDAADNNKWAVYEKIKNYEDGVSYNSLAFPPSQELGHTIFTKDNYLAVLISSPSWNNPSFTSQGRIWVYNKRGKNLDKQFEYILNSNNKTYCNTGTTQFGFSLNYDNNKKFIFAGAPAASDIVSADTGNVAYSTGTGSSKGFISEGLIKISRQRSNIEEEETVAVLVSPYSFADTSDKAEYLKFGNSIYINNVEKTTSTLMLVGAPGDGVVNTSTGQVFAYFVNTSTTGIEIVEHSSGISLTSSISLTSKSKWGEKIVGDETGNFIAITAPAFTITNKTGVVEIFDKSLNSKQIIYSPFTENVIFGDDIFVSPTGKFLFVSASNAKNDDNSFGKIAVYTATNLTSTGTYVLRQVIENPSNTTDLKFGISISLNANEDVLVVSSLGKNRTSDYIFDEITNVDFTTFDQNSTRFISPINDAGTVYIFNNLGDYFVQAEELTDSSILEGSRFGFDVASTNDYVLVGAPWIKNSSSDDDSTFYQFKRIDTAVSSWKKISSQPDLVETNKIKRIALIDTLKEEVIEYLDIFDPVKGKIPGVAEQELKYKSVFDPAIYSIGSALTSVNPSTSWIDDHVGELWWDLSAVKYTWYEQSDDIYRKNNWGRVFPGSTIDIYEWVKSDLLPSEWAIQADTNDGLTRGISGQPKYPDNSVLSVKQVFNNVTNSFENVYYFWVKNKVTIPEIIDRRISSLQVASIIADPAANGIRFAEILSESSIAFANVQPILVNDRINANISFDLINNKIPKHTEWILLEEGNETDVPNTLLTKKLFDSLLGHDSLGNNVPDLSLSYRNRYGISIRPRQSMFKNRLEALRNLIEFSNSILIKNKITGFYSFENLNKQEEIPDILSQEYDIVVEDLEQLELIDTAKFEPATVLCSTFNGKIISASVINTGFGYVLPPKITIQSSSGSGAEIVPEIDTNGRIINLTIVNPGKNYVEDFPEITVRPHTVIVSVNQDYGNKWTKHIFNYELNEWTRIKTQSFNTLLYWKYVDWQDELYNGFKDYKYVINDPSELTTISFIEPGDYIKINNIGDGRYIIIEKLNDDDIGDFALSYKIVFSQFGTIQLLDNIWNYSSSNFSYDAATLEETLYDQIPDLELFYILTALKDDLFVKNLKINWNLFFFKAIRYALTEQKLLDWAFKTSFISVTNQIGELDQRSTYKLDNESYFEEYVKEIKPYRTKIRSYTSKYTLADSIGTVGSSITDFDLPSYYSSLTNNYELVGLSSSKISEYPWKWWADNYKYYVKNILVANGGIGYTQNPTVIIQTAPGDSGSGATAEAYIRNGSVYKILVSNPGSGYIIPPEVHIVGGGPNVTKQAVVSIELSNDYIRKNTISIKFDRTGSQDELTYAPVTESFICAGNTNRFRLVWLAEPNKANIVPLLDGKIVYAVDYTIEYFTENVNNYTRKYCEFVFLNYVPQENQQFKITYHKNIDLYQAVDRINYFYEPTDDMIGKETTLLMSGAEYGNTILQGLTFSHSPPWNQGYFDNNSTWGDLVNYFASAKLIQDAPYSTDTLYLNTVQDIVPGQKVLLTNTGTGYIRNDTVVTSVNPANNSIKISNREYQIKRVVANSTSTQGNIVFFTNKKFNKDIPVGSIAEISGIDTGTITGFDGQYLITNSGSDRFTAIGTGSHSLSILSTTTVKVSGTSAKVFVPSVFKNVDTDTLYNILKFTEYVTNTSTVFYDTKYSANDVSNIEININGSPLGTAVVPAEYYSTTSTNSGTFAFEIYNLGLLSNNLLEVNLYGYPKLEFWKDNFDVTGLDSSISAGSWDSSGNFVGALGVDPTDLIISGNTFVSQDVGFSPEEQVKGSTFETVGISVFTQENNSSPLGMAGVIPVIKDQVTKVKIGIPLDEAVAITVNFDGKMLDRLNEPPAVDSTSTSYVFSSTNQFFVLKDELYIAPQTKTGKAGYNLLTISGEYVADSVVLLTNDTQTTATLVSSARISDVRTLYVTIDGQEIPPLTTPGDLGYELIATGNKNNRAAVRVYNIAPGNRRTIQAWFLKSNYAKFNGMWTETFDVDASTSSLQLSRLPSAVEPLSAQAFVEYSEDSIGKVRLNPPDVVYYKINNGQTVFDIDNSIKPAGTYNISNTRVYSNGQLLAPGFDYSLDGTLGTITLQSGLLPDNTEIAIETLINYDYTINGTLVNLNTAVSNSSTIKVTTFSDNNGVLLRTERFTGNANRRFTLGLPVASSDFIWASVNKIQLVTNYDFELLPDSKTVQFNLLMNITPNDEITISYISSPYRPNIVAGYRIFQDIFNRTNYSRLSDFYSTRLTKELMLTDTEIFVSDASNLVPPNPHKNLPGVIFIDSERIEFFSKDNNILSDLRRSTMGTAPATFSEIGTKIVDQSPQQFVPYSDTINKQYHVTAENLGPYIVNTVTNANNTYTVIISSSTFVINTGTVYQSGGDGITLINDQFLKDQIFVKFGGRSLRKTSTVVHDNTLAYDSTASSLVTLPPEFVVRYNSTSGKFELDIDVADFRPGTKIEIEQKLGTFWQTSTSLLVADTVQANFIRQKPTELPDNWYYGGNPVLTDNDDFELLDENDDPLEGY